MGGNWEGVAHRAGKITSRRKQCADPMSEIMHQNEYAIEHCGKGGVYMMEYCAC